MRGRRPSPCLRAEAFGIASTTPVVSPVLAIALVVDWLAHSVLITNFARRQNKPIRFGFNFRTLGVPAPAAVNYRVQPRLRSRAPFSMRRFDDRIEGLRAPDRNGLPGASIRPLSQDEFVDGINKWLIPQWRGPVRRKLASNS